MGNGFVTGGWRAPGEKADDASKGPRAQFVTALHVIWGCEVVEVYEVDCAAAGSKELVFSLTAESGVRGHPGLDLAVYNLPTKLANRYKEQLSRVQLDARPPKSRGQVRIAGTSVASVCAEGLGFVLGQTTVAGLAAHIARGNTARDKKLRGSMKGKTRILQYWGSATAGTSGAPITRSDRPGEVVGVHQGGMRGENVGWAILLDAQAVTDEQAWIPWRPDNRATGFIAPSLSQSTAGVDARVLDEAKRWQSDQSLVSIGLRMTALGHGGGDSGLAFATEPRIALSSEWIEFPQPGHDMSIAGRIALGYATATVSRRYLGPDGALFDEVAGDFSALNIDAGLELRLRRRERVRPIVYVGVRASNQTNPTADGAGDETTVFGFAAEIRAAITPVSGYHALAIGLSIVTEEGPNPNWTLTGIGADVVGAADERRVHVGLGIAYEY